MERTRQNRIAQWLPIAMISLIVLIVRVWLMSDWLRYDECQHYLIAKSPFLADFIREFRLRAHPPLFYILMKPFVYFSASAYAAKMLSLLSGIISVIIINFTLQRAGMKFWPAQIATLFISFTAVFIEQSIEVRQYGLCLVFIWLSFYLYFRLQKYLTHKLSAHIAIACMQFLAIMTEYSAIFHLLTLSIIIYVPLAFSLIRRKEWKRLVIFTIPQTSVFIIALILFQWHFSNTVPAYGHTQPFFFYGNLTDIPDVFNFFREGFLNFSQTILPNPLGVCLFILLIFPFIPFYGNDPLVQRCRLLSIYVCLSIALVFISALLKLFPFGGLPRHTITILPGITLTWALIIFMIIYHLPLKRKYMISTAAILCIVFSIGYVKAFPISLKPPKRYKELFQESGFSDYAQSSNIIISNWHGRSVLTWWLLPHEYPRLNYHPKSKIPIYYYGQARVIEVEEPDSILNLSQIIARQEGKCWIFLSYPEGSEESSHIGHYLANNIDKNFQMSCNINKDSHLNSIFLKVEKIQHSQISK